MQNIHIILVRPKNDKNIGNVARLMANFACKNLHLVAPRRSIKCNLASVARKGFVLIEQAIEHQDLKSALSNMNLALAFTSARERNIEKITSLKEFCKRDLPENLKIALVFGPEEDGLTRDELFLCNHFVNIPTEDQQSSLNLAQAAGIALYEFYTKDNKTILNQEVAELTQHAELEILDQKLSNIIGKSGFTINGIREDSFKLISNSLKRAELNKRELGLWLSLLDRIDRTL
jgi:tRNA/rRNA methyltransferase